MQKMNRKSIITSIVLIVFMMIPVCVYSVTVSTETYTSVADFTFREAEIYHTPLNSVLPQQGFVNLKFNVDFGDYKKVQKTELLYYFDGDTSNVYTVTDGEQVLNKRDFFVKTDRWIESSSISYQLKVTLTRQDDSLGYAYWPKQVTMSSDTFHIATIATSTSTTIGEEGGSIDIDDGDQSTKDSGIDIKPGTLTPGTEVEVGDLSFDDLFGVRVSERDVISGELSDDDLLFGGKKVSPGLLGRAINGIYIKTNPPQDEFNPPIDFHISLRDTVVTKFVLVYRKDNTIPWTEGEIVKIERVDMKDRLIYGKAEKAGQYAVFESTDLDDSDYRPQKRVKIKSRIANGKYTGFEFKGLKEGDVIKIYNVSGKKIAEITEISLPLGIAYWNGRKGTNNSGDWAESGTYIYQIKLKVKNKIVSGTIAFVW